MSASGEDKKRETAPVVTKDDDRPFVTAYVQKPAYNVGDSVYLQGKGPYLVADVIQGRRYVLNEENGDPVENGREFAADQLQAV